MIFGRPHLDAFAALSHDRNPLHMDEQYAAKTPFGRNVVYGVGAALAALGHWAHGRRFALRSFRAQFRRPVFLDQEYTLRVQEAGNVAEMQILKGGVPRATLGFEWCEYTGPATAASAGSSDFEPSCVSVDSEGIDEIEGRMPRAFVYAPNVGALGGLAEPFGLGPSQMPPGQLSALLWSSYFVGMEVPGRQALFSELAFEFEDRSSESPAIAMTDLGLSVNRGLRRLVISGAGSGIRQFSLTAFVRPPSVIYDAEAVAAEVPETDTFANRVVFISGGSRGFGSVLARSFARQQARLVVNYRSQATEAERLEHDLTSSGRECLLVRGDVRSESDCCAMVRAIQAKYGGIDLLINNASPSIDARQFSEWTPAEVMTFISDSLLAYMWPTHALLPLLRPGGTVLNVSSVYTQAPPPSFVPYVTAKSGIEGFTRVLAQERKDLRFVTVRPPRMLTDQTNIGFELKPPRSAVGVAKALLAAMQRLPSDTNYHELNLA